ncbi:SRPBCC family protein [Streptomyces purpurogeneiscleroticus]|uniref:SRPBCC family protein n=1 Tax=Streptomyces purpurogeneiscleroticus TaxID=68259 RepID=UPI001CC14F82|nr:SRPBCC domain-containing protein [Streptomyces purpurogeneiscleroticus]MBZ4015743.1 ATPase [Streptomyces purpurogeneiscleroticus]
MTDDNGISIIRLFDAPRDRVFRAWTTPEAFAYWYGGELEVPVEGVTMDVRPGGAWHLVVRTQDGGELPFGGVYREIVPPERLVFTLKDASAPEDADGELVAVTLNGLGDKTEMDFQQTGGTLSAEQYAQAKAGWTDFFARLAEYVAH